MNEHCKELELRSAVVEYTNKTDEDLKDIDNATTTVYNVALTNVAFILDTDQRYIVIFPLPTNLVKR